jgi:chorismate mutase/prephenate dehydratase
MADAKREIEELRAEIARLDAQLLGTLEKRAKASRKIGELRKGEPTILPVADRAALHALVARAGHDLSQEAVRDVFRHVFAACLALELPVRVAYPGPEGGPAHAAARGRFGAARAEGEQGGGLVAVDSAAAAIDEVARERAEFAVVPLETRAEGPVQATIEALLASDLKIVSTIEEAWTLHLANKTGNVADVEKVVATASDRAMCSRLLASLGPRVAVIDVKSPLVACQIALEDHGAAALASEGFAVQQGLEIARRNVLDEGDHRVRYAIVGHRPASRSGNDLTSFVFSVDDRPGALLDVLKQFAERGINMVKIHSRPSGDLGGRDRASPGPGPGRGADHGSKERGEWGYLFYVEVVGHATDRTIVTAFEEVRRASKLFKVLGSYPALS